MKWQTKKGGLVLLGALGKLTTFTKNISKNFFEFVVHNCDKANTVFIVTNL
jgi:hypothetical protein